MRVKRRRFLVASAAALLGGGLIFEHMDGARMRRASAAAVLEPPSGPLAFLSALSVPQDDPPLKVKLTGSLTAGPPPAPTDWLT